MTSRHLLKSLVLFIIFGCALIPFPAYADEVTQTYTAGQSGTFVVPDGVTQLRVTMWGGGAGGYAGRSGSLNGTAGGGAGVIVGYNLTVTPGQSISYSVGTGGLGGQSQDTLGSPGGNTTFGNLIAYGGKIGTRAGASGGAGGNATDGTYTAIGGAGGTTSTNGGNGQAVSAGGGTLYGGGGGGAPFSYSDCSTGLGGTSYSNTTACGGYGGGGGASYGPGGNGYRNSTQADSGVNGGGGAGLWAGAGYPAGNGGNGSLQIAYSTSPTTYTVTPTAGTGGSISPSTPQTVSSGATVSFTVTANTGYSIASVTGCSGTLSGNTYTTGAITGNCTVTASFAALILSSVILTPTTVGGGTTAQGTVQLSGPAPEGGAPVSLLSSDPSTASVTDTVMVAAGASSATFTVSTTAVASTTAVSITASYSGTSQSGSLTVTTNPVFSDVASTYWAYTYILSVYNARIMGGCSQNPLAFCPSSQVTRGDTAAFLIRAKFGESFTYTQTPYYTDVPASHPYFKYVQKMKDAGITTTTGTYDVEGTVAREQMAAFLARAFLGMQ